MQPSAPYYSPFAPDLLDKFIPFAPFIAILVLFVVVVKGYALWNAARNSQKWWFIALLTVNTLGILEVVYLIWYRPSSPQAPAVSSSTQV